MKNTPAMNLINLQTYISERYDYIGKADIMKINKDLCFGCTLRQCVDIYNELFNI